MCTARICLFVSSLCLLTAAPAAQAQSGLRFGEEALSQQETWPRWHVRFGLATVSPAIDASNRWQLSGGHLLGDYYWSGLRPAGTGRSGGFRATSGLLLGQRSVALGTPALVSPQGLGLTVSHGSRIGAIPGESSSDAWSVVPYVGVGYSAVSLRGGWGFTADFGLAGTQGGLRALRDGALGAQGTDDVLRELRLRPVVQVGASYAF